MKIVDFAMERMRDSATWIQAVYNALRRRLEFVIDQVDIEWFERIFWGRIFGGFMFALMCGVVLIASICAVFVGTFLAIIGYIKDAAHSR